MRQRILINFLEMAMAMITMNSERGFSREITQFVISLIAVFLIFLRFLRLFAAILSCFLGRGSVRNAA